MGSSRGMRPDSISWIVQASVVPPAGSVKIPSVRASRSIASRISASVADAAKPPESRTTRMA